MAKASNALNVSATGLVKFDGTSTYTGVTTTQYNTLVGSTSNGITNIAPGATSTVYRSAGAAANPTWTSGFTVSSADVMANTGQPAFIVYLSANQTSKTGDNTVYIIPFDTKTKDQATNFTTGAAALFTAPVTGMYHFSTAIEAYNLTSSFTSGLIQLTQAGSVAQVYTGGLFNWGAVANSGGAIIFPWSVDIAMVAADTVQLAIQVAGGTKTVNIAGGRGVTYFSGFLIC